MKQLLLYSLIIFGLLACENKTTQSTIDYESPKDSISENGKRDFAIVIHGGAGTILKKNMTDEREKAYRETLEEAIRTGYDILKNGGSSLDAVTKTINVMENSPLFNAGKGAVFTHEGKNELDASIMDGKTLNAGASAGTTNVKNPIDLARAVMDNSPHVMLSGEGAEEFASEQGLEIVDPSYFFTQSRFDALQRIIESEKTQLDHNDKHTSLEPDLKRFKYGTVGCAALDKNGNLAAGTSTGGMTNKRWGRIGDAPIIGAGTYANNATCAISSTGWGEYFIRSMVAHDISALMEYKGMSLKDAAHTVIHEKVAGLGGDGGIVGVDKDGNIAMEFNTEGMYRASMDDQGKLVIEIYKDEN